MYGAGAIGTASTLIIKNIVLFVKEKLRGSCGVPFKDVKIIKSNSRDANAIQLCKPRQLPLLTVVELSEHTLISLLSLPHLAFTSLSLNHKHQFSRVFKTLKSLRKCFLNSTSSLNLPNLSRFLLFPCTTKR